jgi:hypothetical protein
MSSVSIMKPGLHVDATSTSIPNFSEHPNLAERHHFHDKKAYKLTALARAHLKADETFAPEKLSSRNCEWTAGFDGREIQLE